MTKEEAKKILGDRSKWELIHMRRALSSMPILNSEEENKLLEAVVTLLKT